MKSVAEEGAEEKEKGVEEKREKDKKKKRNSLRNIFKTKTSTEERQSSFMLKRFSLRNHDTPLPPAVEDTPLPEEQPSGAKADGSKTGSESAWARQKDEDLGQTVIKALSRVLRDETSGSAEPQLGSLLEAWGQRNPVSSSEGQKSPMLPPGDRYPQQWRGQFEQQVELSVQLHFPALPPEASTEQPHAYLRQVQEVLQRELLRLAPVLKEAGLLGTVIDRYHVHTVSQLELLLQKNLNANQMFCLLDWTLHTYLSEDLWGHRDLHSDVTNHMDFLLYTECVQKTYDLLLNTTQKEIGVCLQRVLLVAETGMCDMPLKDMSVCDEGVCEEPPRGPVEETTQCVNRFLQRAQELSSILAPRLKPILSAQLQQFVHRYVAMEKKRFQMNQRQTGVTHLYSTCNTCAELRLLAEQLSSEAAAVGLLEELQAQATKQLLDTVTHNTEASLKSYFKVGGDMGGAKESIGQLFAPLPLVKHTHTRRGLVDSVYQKVTSLYLRHLLLSNRAQLEGRWCDVEERVRQDAEELHTTFTQQDVAVQKRCVLLAKVCEVLKSNDVDALKLTLTEIITDDRCPHISEEQLNALLRWKGQLSRQQVTEVMDAVLEHSPRSLQSDPPLKAPHLTPTPRWYCALPCLRPPITA